mmetsp:Transcript_22817/g.73137  ORF Transcript_22817/g.73137 Transcript_22817/m.73137 type:complete len:162 (+) Transcript_22817:40-525(+)
MFNGFKHMALTTQLHNYGASSAQASRDKACPWWLVVLRVRPAVGASSAATHNTRLALGSTFGALGVGTGEDGRRRAVRAGRGRVVEARGPGSRTAAAAARRDSRDLLIFHRQRRLPPPMDGLRFSFATSAAATDSNALLDFLRARLDERGASSFSSSSLAS